MLAIAVGLASMLYLPGLAIEIKRLLDRLYLRTFYHDAARKIQTRFQRNMWKRRYRQQTDGTRDPYSVMGRVTAFDRAGYSDGLRGGYTVDDHESRPYEY